MLGDADCAHQALHLYHGGQGQEGKLRLKPYSPYSSDHRRLLHPSPPNFQEAVTMVTGQGISPTAWRE